MRLYITANSPGELSGWARPLLSSLEERLPNLKTTVVITPCQYASGQEQEVASKWESVDEVIRLNTLIKNLVFSGSKRRREKSCVMFLGGDAFHAVILGKLLACPSAAYLAKPRWHKHFASIMVPDKSSAPLFDRKNVQKDKWQVVGQLALDSVETNKSKAEVYDDLDIETTKDLVTFLPGSRPVITEYMLEFFAKVADSLSVEMSSASFVFCVSPFTTDKQLSDGLKTDIVTGPGEAVIKTKTPGGTPITLKKGGHLDVMNNSLGVLCIPGTNNLQLAYLQVPSFIIIPLNRAEKIPLDGLAGLLNPDIPPIGYIKKKIMLYMHERTGFLCTPNHLAGREVMPEIRGILDPSQIAKNVSSSLSSNERRASMINELASLSLTKGAAGKMANTIESLLKG